MKTKILGLTVALLLIGVNGWAADGDLIVNGNTGLGTTSPSARLQIGDFLKIFSNNGAATDMNYIRGVNNHLVVQANGDLFLNYPENNAGKTRIGETLFVQRQGNVGIGTADPTQTLDVNGNIAANNLKAIFFYSQGEGETLRLTDNNGVHVHIQSFDGVFRLVNSPWTFEFFRVTQSGDVYATHFHETSDAKFKANVTPINNALDRVLQLNGVSFNWNKELIDKGLPTGKDYGVIAQDVEAVLPEAVSDGPNGAKAVAYTKMIPFLIEAMKEQQKQIDALKSEVTALKTKQ
jgi:hypothetical protein